MFILLIFKNNKFDFLYRLNDNTKTDLYINKKTNFNN